MGSHAEWEGLCMGTMQNGGALYEPAEWRGFVREPCRMEGLCMGTMQNGGALYGNHAEWRGMGTMQNGGALYGNHAEWRGSVWEPCRMEGLCMGIMQNGGALYGNRAEWRGSVTMQNGGALYGNHAEWRGFVWELCMKPYHGTFSEMILFVYVNWEGEAILSSDYYNLLCIEKENMTPKQCAWGYACDI